MFRIGDCLNFQLIICDVCVNKLWKILKAEELEEKKLFQSTLVLRINRREIFNMCHEFIHDEQKRKRNSNFMFDRMAKYMFLHKD